MSSSTLPTGEAAPPRIVNRPARTPTISILPPAMHVTSPLPPDYIFFSDFDGTITAQDSNDHMTDSLGFGRARRLELNDKVLAGEMAFRDAFHAMLESVSATTGFGDCVKACESSIELDAGFDSFWRWCLGDAGARKQIPIVVLSGGMKPVINALLRKLLGKEEMEKSGMEVISNTVKLKEGKESVDEVGGWEIGFRDQSDHGHDKAIELRRYSSLDKRSRPIMFFAGDGVSDLSAARETDLLFAKEGCSLVDYCEGHGIPFRTFRHFGDVQATVADIVEGRLGVKEAATGRQTW